MRETRDIMGMPITIDAPRAKRAARDAVFAHFVAVDERFSTYKPHSEISQINAGTLALEAASAPMREVFALAEETRIQTDGYFSIRRPDGLIDPSGLVKGWAIARAAELFESLGVHDYFINAGGDIASRGVDERGEEWTVGIRNPFSASEILKVLSPRGAGVATSGTYIRGAHIWDPHTAQAPQGFVSLTVIGPTVYDADRFATAAFAMGESGVHFIENLQNFEAYAVNGDGIATMTSGFESYVC